MKTSRLLEVKKYSDELETLFPQNTLEERQLFALLNAAYVDARYNLHINDLISVIYIWKSNIR